MVAQRTREIGHEAPKLPFRRIHFVGIGGIGMSGIARVLLNLGCRVSGSDVKPTEITRQLSRSGARVFTGHKAAFVDGADAVVISSAVKPDNPEVKNARNRGIPVLRRAEMLSELARLKITVTIAGCHGKTTTTSMVAMALAKAGADPTMIIGGQLKNIGSNARLGAGDYLVAEADESDGSFLLLSPKVAVVTNIDNDHLDYYKNMHNVRGAFEEHLRSVPADGAAVVCSDDSELGRLIPELSGNVIRYGLSGRTDWTAKNIRPLPAGSTFDLVHRGRKIARARLSVPGRHNVLNALGAIAAGHFLGFNLKKLLAGLAEFRGVGRRLDRLGEAGGVTFLDDYGHHPTEIRTTLAAVRELYKGRLIAIFQPHRYSRTKLLQDEFGRAFKAADFVYVDSIYAAGEKPIAGVSSGLVLRALKRSHVACAPMPRAVDLARELRRGDVVITIGAGDIWKVGEDLRRRLTSGSLSVY